MTSYQPSVEGAEAILFAQVMGDAEEAHARLESKFTLAKWILSGRNVNRGGQPYQDFALLMRLRNDLVHTKPNKLFVHGVTTNEEAHGALLARFRDKNILADDNVTGSWTYLAQTKAVAEWSLRLTSSTTCAPGLLKSASRPSWISSTSLFNRTSPRYRRRSPTFTKLTISIDQWQAASLIPHAC